MEGKNCFRPLWSQKPLYSGGSFSLLQLATPALNTSRADNEEEGHTLEKGQVCLVMACGNEVNVVSSTTGELIASTALSEEDVILSIDAVSAHHPASHVMKRRKLEDDGNPSQVKREAEDEEAQQSAEDVVPAGDYIAVGTRLLQLYVFQVVLNEGEVELKGRNTYSLKLVKQWTAAQHAISFVAFSRSGRYLVSGSSDGSVKVWNVFHHHLTHNLRCPSSTLINTVMLDESERYLITGSFEGHVTVFDLDAKSAIATSRPHVQAVEAITLRLPEGLVFSIGRDRKLSVMKLHSETRKLEPIRSIVVKEPLSAACFEGHAWLHTGAQDGSVSTYTLGSDGKVSRVLHLPKPAAANAEDRTEELTIRALHPKSMIKGLSEGLWHTDHTPGRSPLFVADMGFTVSLLSEASSSANEYQVEFSLVCYLDQVLAINLLPPSLPFQRLVVNNSKDVRLYDNCGCYSSRSLQGHTDIVMTAAVTGDGRLIATGGKDNEIRFWSTSTWKAVAIGEGGHTAEVTSIRFNSKQAEDSLLLFSIAADENLRIWDVAKHVLPLLSEEREEGSGSAAVRFLSRSGVNGAHMGSVYALEVSPNDQYVATGGKDRLVNLWGINGKKAYKEATLKGHRRAVTSLAFSTADRVLASGSNDGTVRLWSLTSLTCVKSLQADKAAVLQVALFNSGTQLVSTNAEGLVRVWALGAGEVVWTGEDHEEKVWALAVREDGDETLILTGSADGVVMATIDVTAEEVMKVRQEREEVILKEQELSNMMRRKDFAAAFHLALRLDHPRHLRQVMEQWTAKDSAECEKELGEVILPALNETLLMRLLQFVREWMTNSRHSGVGSSILRPLLSYQHFEAVAKIPAMKQLIEPLLAYSRKHSQRVHDTLHRTYYVDYATRSLAPQQLTSVPPYVSTTV